LEEDEGGRTEQGKTYHMPVRSNGASIAVVGLTLCEQIERKRARERESVMNMEGMGVFFFWHSVRSLRCL
jgi:hypothetical protein